MKIVSVEFRPCEMPLEDKKWRFALGTASQAQGWVVELGLDDGMSGYGYASASPHMGSSFAGLPIELERFRPIVLGRDVSDIEGVLADMDRSLVGASQAKGAVDCAMHDLLARSLGVELCRILGGRLRDDVPVIRILAIKSPDEMAQQAARLVEDGYSHLKIKVHGDVEEDVARVQAIRQRIGPKVHLTIDANQSYTPKDAIYAIQRMADFRIDLVEQPVHRNDLKGLEMVTRAVSVTVEADESAGTLSEIMSLVSNRIVDAVSLKLPKLGGLRNALVAARICEVGGVRCRLGAHVGSRLLNAHALQLAAALPNLDYACELGEFTRMHGDPFQGIEVVKGRIALPGGIGCGVDPAAVADFAVSEAAAQ